MAPKRYTGPHFGVGLPSDPQYASPVNGLGKIQLSENLRKSIELIAEVFPPKTGIALFVFDYGEGGGIGYVSNSERRDMIKAMKEWLRKQGEVTL